MKGQPFDLVWLHDPFGAENQRFSVDGLIEPGSFVVLYGESGSGKSTVAIDMGMHIAQGTPWRDRTTHKGFVLHIAGEGGRGVRMRLMAWVAHYNATRTLPYAILPRAVDIGSRAPNMVSTVLEAAAGIGEDPRLVIVDTLARCHVGDENTSHDMGTFIAGCDAIRTETGAAVMTIHHVGKDPAKGARGHSSLRAAADTELLIEGQTNPRTLSVKKQRDLELGEPMGLRLEQVVVARHSESDQPITSVVVEHDEQAPVRGLTVNGKHRRAVLAALRERFREAKGGHVSEVELQELLRAIIVDRRRASEVRSSLVGNGVLVRAGGGYDVNLEIIS